MKKHCCWCSNYAQRKQPVRAFLLGQVVCIGDILKFRGKEFEVLDVDDFDGSVCIEFKTHNNWFNGDELELLGFHW